MTRWYSDMDPYCFALYVRGSLGMQLSLGTDYAQTYEQFDEKTYKRQKLQR